MGTVIFTIIVIGLILILVGLIAFILSKKLNTNHRFSFQDSPPTDEFEVFLNSSFDKSYQKDFKGAIEDIDHALELHPYMEKLYFQRAKLFEELNDYEKSKSDYTKAIILKDDYDEAYLNRGLIKLKLKDYFGAKKDLAKAQELNSDLLDSRILEHETEINISKLNLKQRSKISKPHKIVQFPLGKAQ